MVCSSPPLPQTSRHAEKEVQCLGLELMQERENMNSVLKGPIDDVRSHPGRVETHHPPTLTCQWGLPTKDGSVPLPLRTAWSVPFPPNTKDPEVCPMTPSLSALRSGPGPAHPHEGSEVLWPRTPSPPPCN